MSWIIFRLGLDPKMLAKILNMSSGRCWSSDTYNPCPGVFENVPSSNNYDGGFGTALMTKVKPVVVERRERENSVCKSNWILLFISGKLLKLILFTLVFFWINSKISKNLNSVVYNYLNKVDHDFRIWDWQTMQPKTPTQLWAWGSERLRFTPRWLKRAMAVKTSPSSLRSSRKCRALRWRRKRRNSLINECNIPCIIFIW